MTFPLSQGMLEYMNKNEFDFFYAMNNTEVVLPPSGRLETFGNTVVNYHLLCEDMDDINQVNIREGRVEAFRPQILTPQNMEQSALDGFGDEAERYMAWLKEHMSELVILRYGFMIKKEEIRKYVVHEKMPTVLAQVRTEVENKKDPLSAIVVGVEKPWEVSLMKLMVDVMQKSVVANVNDLKQRNLLPMDPEQSARMKKLEIEDDFKKAETNPILVRDLGRKLQKYGLFNDYEDRYFALMRKTGA
jgi:hypothetical protein